MQGTDSFSLIVGLCLSMHASRPGTEHTHTLSVISREMQKNKRGCLGDQGLTLLTLNGRTVRFRSRRQIIYCISLVLGGSASSRRVVP
jgi:hypothetical protein